MVRRPALTAYFSLALGDAIGETGQMGAQLIEREPKAKIRPIISVGRLRVI